MKTYITRCSIEHAKEIGFTQAEKTAKANLKKIYPKDKWVGAEIVADIVGDKFVCTMKGE